MLRMARQEWHPAAEPGLSDRSLRIIPTIRARVSCHIWASTGSLKAPFGESHPHAGCLVPNGQKAAVRSADTGSQSHFQTFDRKPQLVFGKEASCGTRTYRIFTDGSVIGNPGPVWMGARCDAGCVCVERITLGNVGCPILDNYLGDRSLFAAVQALRPLPDQARVELQHSDLGIPHVMGSRGLRVSHWQRQGWRNRRGNRLAAPRELWSELIGLNVASFTSVGHGSEGTTEIWSRAALTRWPIRPLVNLFKVQQKAAA